MRSLAGGLDICGSFTYFPYGSHINDLCFEEDISRLGFQGQERDDEISGVGNSLNYTFRNYDSELGLFRSIDPLADKFPSIGSYVAFNAIPILFVDPDGRSGKSVINEKEKTYTVYSKIYFYGTKATTKNAKKIAKDIAYQWNYPQTSFSKNGKIYKIKFRISYETVTEKEALKLSVNNKDPMINFMRLESAKKSSISLVHKNRGTNSFWININDASTTSSHEYGHGLGIYKHTPGGSSSINRPDIMTARGTRYGNKYSLKHAGGWNIVNPNSRQVTNQNIIDALNKGLGEKDIFNYIIDEKGEKYTNNGGKSWKRITK
jgi:RHS repeat-associated protein